MSGRFARARSRLSPAKVFLALLAVGIQLAWLAFAARSWQPAPPSPALSASPRIVFLDHLPRDAAPGARELGSPVLFAFPSAPGFSGAAAASRPHVSAALAAEGREPVLLEGPARREASAEVLPGPGPFLASAPPAVPDLGSGDPVFSAAPGSTGFALQVYWPDGMPAVRAGLPGAGLLAPVLKDRAWELQALLIFDAGGLVQNLFLEKPTPQKDRNDTLIRALRQLRIDPPGEELRARIALVYAQGAPLRTPPGAGAGARP